MKPLRVLPCLSVLALPAAAQIVNPADKHEKPQQLSDTHVEPPKPVSGLSEEDRVGPYGQPEWTTHRRFPFTRTYVRPPNTFAFEYWLRPTIPRHGGPTEMRTQYEFEIGLPGRWQLDLYLNQLKDGGEGPMETENSTEVRYAFADWGKLWGNPTAYLEYKSRDAKDDVIEAKMLLGDELSSSWHWGTNLVFEREIGGDLENVYGLTAGISKTLSDQCFSIGAELKGELVDTVHTRGDFEEILLLGPSLQYRPSSHVHMDLAPLVGIGPDSPALQAIFVIGYEF
jgi:hypothetical protein